MVDIVVPPRSERLFDESGVPTLRFAEFLESLTDTTNTTTSEVSSLSFENVLALVNDLQNTIGSGDSLTSDEEGFTVDSDRLSADQDEA